MQIAQKLKQLKANSDVSVQATVADEITDLADPASLKLSRKEYEAIVAEVGTFKKTVTDAQQKITAADHRDEGQRPSRNAACAILEGAKEAFTRRANMYGFAVQSAA